MMINIIANMMGNNDNDSVAASLIASPVLLDDDDSITVANSRPSSKGICLLIQQPIGDLHINDHNEASEEQIVRRHMI